MWRLAIVVVLAVGACDGGPEPAADAAVGMDGDTLPDAHGPAPDGGGGNASLDVGAGGACRRPDDYFCAEYGGACVDGVCRSFCGVGAQRCTTGHAETAPGGQCVCVTD
jgi:hypothetical protein